MDIVEPKHRVSESHLWDITHDGKHIGQVWTHTIFIDKPYAFNIGEMALLISHMKL